MNDVRTFGEPGPAASWLTEDGGTTDAEHDGLGVREHGGDLVASGAFHVHEEAVRVLNQTLQLVLTPFVFGTRVQKVLGQLKHTSLYSKHRLISPLWASHFWAY